MGETTYEVESGRDEGHKVCRESKIVSKGKGLDTVEGGKSSEKRVVGEDEDKRREGAALLDASVDVDEEGGTFTKARGHLDIIEGALDEGGDPRREAGLIDDLEGPVMVDGVKGFRCVKEKQEVLYLAGNTLEEVLVDFDGMVHAILPPKETFLRRVDESGDGGHDGVSHSGGEEPIVGVGDGNGPSVRDKTGVLLRDEEEEAVIEAWWRVLTTTQCLDDR